MLPNERVGILLVDDREDGLLALEAVLQNPEYNLVKARSGQEAIAALSKNDFAIILLDVQMPNLDGFQTASIIKQREECREIPIVFVTAISKEEEFVYRGYEVGAIDYVFKPFDPHILRSKVAVFVDLYRKNQKVKRQAELVRQNEQLEHEKHVARIELENLRRYRKLTDLIPAMIFEAGASGETRYFNQVWFDYTGLTPEQCHRTGWQSVIHIDDMADLNRAWSQAMSTQRLLELMVRIKRASDGTFRWHSLRLVPEMRSPGVSESWLGIFSDIDDLRVLELRQEQLIKNLEQSNRNLEEFAFIASHDLQEPLRKIAIFGEILSSRHGANLDKEGLENLQKLQNSAKKMKALIDSLLTYSQVSNRDCELTPVPLNSIVKDAISTLEVVVERTKAEIIVGDLPIIQGDAIQLQQLFQNLIGNALKFKKSDVSPVIKIYSSVFEERRLSVRNRAQLCQITVEDNGIGFSEENASHLFNMFQRLHNRHEYEGAGIGLAVCRKIAELHGGKIFARSQPGEGSKFILTIPMKKPMLKAS